MMGQRPNTGMRRKAVSSDPTLAAIVFGADDRLSGRRIALVMVVVFRAMSGVSFFHRFLLPPDHICSLNYKLQSALSREILATSGGSVRLIVEEGPTLVCCQELCS
jgi:hypothetical protein